tara:strand:- start:3363 stop:3821 length:459 start_codon:yes stop_codon:yes gene_type:complete
MKKINLKISPLYGLYKQLLYFFLVVLTLFVFVLFSSFWYVFLVIGIILSLRIIYGIIYFQTISIEIFEDHISVKEGVFTNSKSYLELYRITDYEISQSFFMRIFSLMTVRLHSTDKTSPILDFTGVPKSDVVDIIRTWVEAERKRKGVRLFE